MEPERVKTLAGGLYDPMDPELVAGGEPARDLSQALNATREAEQEARRRIVSDLFWAGGDTVLVQPEFGKPVGNPCRVIRRITEGSE